MATCLEITLDLITEKLSIAKMDEARKAANFLNNADRLSNSAWSGPKGNKLREGYNEAQKVWNTINAELREVMK